MKKMFNFLRNSNFKKNLKDFMFVPLFFLGICLVLVLLNRLDLQSDLTWNFVLTKTLTKTMAFSGKKFIGILLAALGILVLDLYLDSVIRIIRTDIANKTLDRIDFNSGIIFGVVSAIILGAASISGLGIIFGAGLGVIAIFLLAFAFGKSIGAGAAISFSVIFCFILGLTSNLLFGVVACMGFTPILIVISTIANKIGMVSVLPLKVIFK